MATTFHADRDGVRGKWRSKSRASNSRRKPIWRASIRVSVASCPCSSLATSSSWTISARTSRWQSGRWSEPPAQGSGICRHTRPFSIRSSKPTLKSNTGCGRTEANPRSDMAIPRQPCPLTPTQRVQQLLRHRPDMLPSKPETPRAGAASLDRSRNASGSGGHRCRLCCPWYHCLAATISPDQR